MKNQDPVLTHHAQRAYSVRVIQKPAIKYLACFRAHKSQYIGEWQYQIEAIVNGTRVVHYETATTVREAKQKFSWHFEQLAARE